jgi:HEAT repeat protein
MKGKGCAIAIVGVLVALNVVAAAIFIAYRSYQNTVNPVFRGRGVQDWADIAIEDRDPIKRREAAETLAEAFKEMGPGGPRISLTMRFCGHTQLPKEVLPFLLQALHAEEMPPAGYASMAVSRVEPDAAIPALIELILHDDSEHACESAAHALSEMGPQAEKAFNEAMADCPEPRRSVALAGFRHKRREGGHYR